MTAKSILTAMIAAAALLAPGPAAAVCMKPIVPYCASDGELGGRYITESQCRRSVKQHLAELESYKRCLTATLERLDSEVESLDRLLAPGSGNGRVETETAG